MEGLMTNEVSTYILNLSFYFSSMTICQNLQLLNCIKALHNKKNNPILTKNICRSFTFSLPFSFVILVLVQFLLV